MIAEKVFSAAPEIRDLAPQNRGFLRRAVEYIVNDLGIVQFLDIGTGLPTQDNVHQVAQRHRHDARVVYVDNDPSVLAHSHALLLGDPNTDYIDADLRNPQQILSSETLDRLLDLDQPVALLLVAILHFIPDADKPDQIVRELVEALPAGSYLALSHVTSTGTDPALLHKIKTLYKDAPTPLIFRTRDQIEEFFTGLELTHHGLQNVSAWNAVDLEPLGPLRILSGVARKP